MTYIYDVTLNFQKEMYEFYEWNNKDNIIHIKKMPIIKINNKDLNTIYNFKIKINSDILELINNKTEKYNLTKIKYSAIFTDKINSLAILFDKNGEEVKRSKLLIIDEDEIINNIEQEPERIIKITKLNKIIKNSLTRKELSIRNKIINILKKTYKNKEYEKLEYLYYEYFNKEIKDYHKMYCELMKELSNKYNDKHIEIYNDLMLEKKAK